MCLTLFLLFPIRYADNQEHVILNIHMTSLQESENDDDDWRLNTGSTKSGLTGPTVDHTTGSGNHVLHFVGGDCKKL